MWTLGDIFFEQAPEISREAKNESKNKLLKEVPIDVDVLDSENIDEIISWFANHVLDCIFHVENSVEKVYSQTLFSPSMQDFFHMSEVKEKLYEILYQDLLRQFDTLGDFLELRKDYKWTKYRKQFKDMYNGKQSFIDDMSWEWQNVALDIESMFLELWIQRVSVWDLELQYLYELRRALKGKYFETLTNDEVTSTWSVLKFGKKSPWYRCIIRGNEFVWIYTHMEYEKIFLESFYGGHSFPPSQYF